MISALHRTLFGP